MRWTKKDFKNGLWFAWRPVWVQQKGTWVWFEAVYWEACRDQSGRWCYTYWPDLCA
jgi:hypothetical protein